MTTLVQKIAPSQLFAMLTSRKFIDASLFFIAFILFWEWSVYAFEIKAYLLPPPSAVWLKTIQSIDLLWLHTLVTLWEVLFGFAAAVVLGTIIAIGIYFVPLISRTIYPFVIAMQGIPKVALAPLIIVWFGYGLTSKVIMAFLFAFFPIVISTIGGLNSTPENLIEHFKALRMGGWNTFWKLRAPSALPNFIDGCKVAMPLAVIGAVVGEFVGSSDGLGNLILLATGSSETALTFAALGAVTMLSLVLYLIVELLGSAVWWRAR